jgi:imidazolonepropionase
MRCDTLWTDARLATLAGSSLGQIEHGVVAARDGRIVYVGPEQDAPRFEANRTVSCDGRWITPGLIDCHTHLVHAGDRAHEFELRLAGASYEEIARAGGGIVSTMTATRAASEDELITAALPRLDALLAEGATTVEVKSGYGLSLADELKQLRAARALGDRRHVSIKTTFLGAHALPPEHRGDPDAYIDAVCNEMIPAVAADGLADAVDAFCEGIGFTPEQTRRVFEAARAHGLPVKLLRRHRVPIALATDCNPGTSPLTSLLLTMNMAATLFRLTVEECLAGVTREAALALGVAPETGTLEVGKWCDLAMWDVERPAELVYRMGFNPLHARIWRGQ